MALNLPTTARRRGRRRALQLASPGGDRHHGDMPCLPARATLGQLDDQAAQRHAADPALSPPDAREEVAALFEFPSWQDMRDAVERRDVLNRCDLTQARAEIERRPEWATADL